MERIIRTNNIFEVRNVTKSFRDGNEAHTVLDNISFDVRAGEFLAIVGPSGSGKTTLLGILGLIDQPDQGRVYFNGEPLQILNDEEQDLFRNEYVGFIFQFFNLIPELTARGNIMLPLLLAGVPWSHAKKRADGILVTLDLEQKVQSYSTELSGGQQQRVAIGRALAKNSMVIIADEPTAHLDYQRAQQLIEIVSRLAHEQRVTIILATHDLEIAKLADRTLVVHDGKILSEDITATLEAPFAERASLLRQELTQQVGEHIRREETRSRKLSTVLYSFLGLITIAAALTANSILNIFPSLAIPQVKQATKDYFESIRLATRNVRPEGTSNESQETIKVTEKESLIITLFEDLLGRKPTDEELATWREKEYDNTTLRFEFVKSSLYQNYLREVERTVSKTKALKELSVAIFEEQATDALLTRFQPLPLDAARKLLVQSDAYRRYLSTKARTIREAEIEYVFEATLDRAPKNGELQKYTEGNLYMDEIQREIQKSR